MVGLLRSGLLSLVLGPQIGLPRRSLEFLLGHIRAQGLRRFDKAVELLVVAVRPTLRGLIVHIRFTDESGAPPKPGQKEPCCFVVGGVIVPEGVWRRIRDAYHGMRVRRRIRGELKWRFFAPNNQSPENPFRRFSGHMKGAW